MRSMGNKNHKNSKKEFNLFEYVKNHALKISFIFVLIVVIVPIIFWAIMHFAFKRIMTIDALLGYAGSVIGGCISLFIAFIGIFENEKRKEEQERLQSDLRRLQIKPILSLKYEFNEDSTSIVFTINNASDNKAFFVYFYDKSIASFIDISHPRTIKVSIDDYNTDANVILDSKYCPTNDLGLPKTITLVYTDIDNNTIMQDFRYCTDESFYEPNDPEYY